MAGLCLSAPLHFTFPRAGKGLDALRSGSIFFIVTADQCSPARSGLDTKRTQVLIASMTSRQSPLTLIVAMTAKHGIGKDNGLPWPMLRKEMAYFARVTQRVPSETSYTPSSPASPAPQNVVIMGRKTWDGIPAKFRPLKNRTNLVITRSPEQFQATIAGHDRGMGQVLAASSIEAGLDELNQRARDERLPPAGRVFVIGGASIYDAALRLGNAKYILLTRVEPESGPGYDCDTFFPVDVDTGNSEWSDSGVDALRDFTGETFDGDDAEFQEVDGDRMVRCRFKLYEKS